MVNFYIFCPCSVQWTNLHSQFKLRIFCPDTKYLWKYIKTLIFFFFIVQNHLVGNFSSSFNFVFKILKQTQKRYDNWIFLGKTVNQPVFLTKKKMLLKFFISSFLVFCSDAVETVFLPFICLIKSESFKTSLLQLYIHEDQFTGRGLFCSVCENGCDDVIVMAGYWLILTDKKNLDLISINTYHITAAAFRLFMS